MTVSHISVEMCDGWTIMFGCTVIRAKSLKAVISLGSFLQECRRIIKSFFIALNGIRKSVNVMNMGVCSSLGKTDPFDFML